MKKIKYYVIGWINSFLGTDLLHKDLAHQQIVANNQAQKISQLEHELFALRSTLNVGVDYHEYKGQRSWAIVCVAGKAEYIKLFDFPEQGAEEIRRFLRNFENRNVIIDRAPGRHRGFFFQ